MTDEKQTPVFKVNAGAMQVSVWKNEAEKNGQKFTAYNTTLVKSYKDKDDEWKESKSLSSAEIPKAIALLDQAYKWIISQKKE